MRRTDDGGVKIPKNPSIFCVINLSGIVGFLWGVFPGAVLLWVVRTKRGLKISKSIAIRFSELYQL